MIIQHEKLRRKSICLHLELPHPLYYNDWILIINPILPHTELFNSLSHDLCYWVGMLWSYCQWKYKKKLVTDEHFVAQILVCCEKMIVIRRLTLSQVSSIANDPLFTAYRPLESNWKLKSISYCLETRTTYRSTNYLNFVSYLLPRYYIDIKKYERKVITILHSFSLIGKSQII